MANAVPARRLAEEVAVKPAKYLVTSRRYADAEYGDTVSLVPTGAVLALVEGGHLLPVTEDRPTVAATKKE